MNLKQVILVLLFSTITYCASAQDQHSTSKFAENKGYRLWSSIHSTGVREIKGLFGQKEYFETDEIYIEDYDFIQSLPISVKTVIAAYTRFALHLFDKDVDKNLAKALGNFESLADAQKVLLTNFSGEIPKCQPYDLSFRNSRKSLFFSHSGSFGSIKAQDEFHINEDGTVSYVAEPLVHIPYDRNKIQNDDSYYNFTFKLNGEDCYFGATFLDPDNIESVIVNQRERTISITQKNQNPEYFSLSMIELDKLPVKAKNIKDFFTIKVIDNNQEEYTYYKEIKIELSCVQNITSHLYDDNEKYKWLEIKLKK